MLYDERVIEMETIIESKNFKVEAMHSGDPEINTYFKILLGKQRLIVMRNDIRELKNIVDTIEDDFL